MFLRAVESTFGSEAHEQEFYRQMGGDFSISSMKTADGQK
jgi:hypothetical protein